MNEDLRVSWEQYHQLLATLAQTITRSGQQFDQILCIARGGLRVGDILSRRLHLPLAILSVSSYGDSRYAQGLRIAEHMTYSHDLGDRLLVADDMVDSGNTLKAVLQWLDRHYRFTVVKTAVIWYKAHSQIVPDFYVQYLDRNPWIHQPFEV
jgi:hypoxanthine phosphoribosyltransferase